MTTPGPLPPLPQRLVRIDFGHSARHPTVMYTAPPDVIARFLPALKRWNPDYTVEVEPLDTDDGGGVPPMPMWRLWAWE
ncbi:hypothetical protein [Nocardia wallacei]|uniref:hypothetical protein n=1 Tax=Nocardia wallacei TaxID=480035 RepID=UPI002453D0DD|nr:hypothetical protein [Nocardia wallacei]